MSKYKAKGIFGAFRNASRGIRLALKSEGNIRIHFVVAILVLLSAYYLNFTVVKFCILSYPSAIQRDNLACQIVRGVDQLKYKGSNFFRPANSVSRDFIDDRRQFFVTETMVHISINQTTGDGIDVNVAGSQFLTKCLCESIDGTFGSRIGNLCRSTGVPPDGGNVNDTSTLLFEHKRNCLSAGIKDGIKIGTHQMMPLIIRHFL